MIKQEYLNLYRGEGKKRAEPLPEYEPFQWQDRHECYKASPGLRKAVNVALALGQPLLITGEPGTGKTQLASSIAWELNLPLLPFHTKTTSTAVDLFYQYDALRRFQDVHLNEPKKDFEHYINCKAMGNAVLLTDTSDLATRLLSPRYRNISRPVRSVVLIDEIDKAPRDLPNDVLNEIEEMAFTIKEQTDWPTFRAAPQYRPIVVMTSNSEKDLPDAFLRRCVYFHIEFPDAQTLKDIVNCRFKVDSAMLDGAVTRFEAIRRLPQLKKKPATAEFLAWLSFLSALNVDINRPKNNQLSHIETSCSVLAKNNDDLKKITAWFKKTLAQQA
ncbi:MAG TPA: MoxR family ATPase [Thermodesulfovibrionia bacterium]|nr:MoxR family ATPase [Thermodesulfovibrionia bacterium]